LSWRDGTSCGIGDEIAGLEKQMRNKQSAYWDTARQQLARHLKNFKHDIASSSARPKGWAKQPDLHCSKLGSTVRPKVDTA